MTPTMEQQLLAVCKRLLGLHYDTGKPSVEGLEATRQAEEILSKIKQQQNQQP